MAKTWNPVEEVSGRTSNMPTRVRRGSDLVYESSRWHRYQHRTYTDMSDDALRVEQKGQENFERWPDYMRESFVRLYTDAAKKLEEVSPGDGWAEKAHEVAEELPEFRRLQNQCRGDRLWSGMSSTAISESVLDAMPEPDEPVPDLRSLERRVHGLEGLVKVGVPVEKEAKAAESALGQAEQKATDYADGIDAGAIRQAIRRGCRDAQEKIDSAGQAMSAFGWGDEAGADGRGGDIDQKRKLLARVQKSEKLKALAKLAGRMRRTAAAKQRSKADHLRDELSDVTLGNDIARMLPAESLKLAVPELELLFFKGLLEHGLMNYELRGTEPQQEGPIIICVDNSGSMAGDRELWSKAVALGLLDIARRQNRSFALIQFDTRVTARLIWERGPNPPWWGQVLEAMEHFSGGGTNFEPPLKSALELIDKEGFDKADVILVTDGMASTDYAREFRHQMEKRKATAYGVAIRCSGDALEAFCDRVTEIDDVDGPNGATDVLFTV